MSSVRRFSPGISTGWRDEVDEARGSWSPPIYGDAAGDREFALLCEVIGVVLGGSGGCSLAAIMADRKQMSKHFRGRKECSVDKRAVVPGFWVNRQ